MSPAPLSAAVVVASNRAAAGVYADAVVVVPEDVTALDAGASVCVLPLDTGLDGGL